MSFFEKIKATNYIVYLVAFLVFVFFIQSLRLSYSEYRRLKIIENSYKENLINLKKSNKAKDSLYNLLFKKIDTVYLENKKINLEIIKNEAYIDSIDFTDDQIKRFLSDYYNR